MSKKNDAGCVLKKTSIGGQALIEGIMMRGPHTTSMAVRHTSGEIVTENWETSGQNRPRFLKFPFIRGVYNFVDSMVFGYKTLMRSAELAGLEEEQPKKKKDTTTTEADNASTVQRQSIDGGAQQPILNVETVAVAEREQPQPAESKKNESKGEQLWFTLVMVLSVVLGVALALLLFMYLPSFLVSLLLGIMPVEKGSALQNILRAVFEGVIRILLFIGYMVAVSLMKDIRRVFMYHGAEHKTIFCYEKGDELTVENVRRQTRFHPRCGTSFMILMLLVGIVISMFITASTPLLRTGIKLLTIPLIVGIGYELIKLAGRSDSLFVRIISAPGLWLQRITTKEPTDDMIEVAITALKMVIPHDSEADRL